MNAINSCINSQQLTQEDITKIKEDINCLDLDIQYEKNCLEEFSKIVYCEDMKSVNVKNKVNIINFYDFIISIDIMLHLIIFMIYALC